MEYTKREAVAIVTKCAKEYEKKLAGTTVMIVYRDRMDHKLKYLEIVFNPTNFQHLTGLLLVDKNGNELEHKSLDFYHKCLHNHLSTEEIRFKPDFTTPLKLEALPKLMDLTKITKITGDYDQSKPRLKADKVAGSVNYCLAVSRDEKGMYYPKSGLLEDIRDITMNQSQVLAILQKRRQEKRYRSIKYVAKGLNLLSVRFPEEIADLLQICDKKNENAGNT